MKGRFWRKALAAALALMVVSGNVPIRSVADLFGGAAITASAEEGEAAFGQCGENAYFSFETDTGKLTISGTGAMYDYNVINDLPWYNYRDHITSVEIENGITSIGHCAFYKCTSLTSITIPDSVKSIGYWAFYKCTSLESVTIPDSVTSIGGRTFSDCTGLTSITIPDSVKSIGEDAFYNCTNITDVYCYAYPDKLTWNDGGCNDFKKEGSTVCHVREEHIDTYESEFGGKVNVRFEESAMDKCGDHAYWCFESDTGKLTISGTGTMYDYEYTTQPWYNYKDNITSVKIENGITSIGNSAFERFAKLTSGSIPDSVTSIGYAAFQSCTSLTSIEIPASVTSIVPEAFYDCTGITDVYCYADPDKLTWYEFGCDDFIKTPKHTTVCHVPKKYLEGYEAKFGAGSETPVNVTFVGDVDMGLGEHLYGHSITLDGSIGVNFYVELTDALLASENAEMVFTVPNGSKTDTQTLLVKDVIADDNNKVSIGSKTYYKFKCSVSAKDMASTITAQLVDGKKSGTEYRYSVKEYADYLLEHTEGNAEYAKAAPLVKAMLNYGAYSQRYFKEGTAVGGVQDIANVTVPNTFKFDEVSTSLPEGVTFEGATLSLRSETTLSLYFKSSTDLSFMCVSYEVEKDTTAGGYQIARIRGIKADDLDKAFTLRIFDASESGSIRSFGGRVAYCPLTYCYNVLNGGSEDENLQNVCRALYLYAQAANDYSEQGVNGDE